MNYPKNMFGGFPNLSDAQMKQKSNSKDLHQTNHQLSRHITIVPKLISRGDKRTVAFHPDFLNKHLNMNMNCLAIFGVGIFP